MIENFKKLLSRVIMASAIMLTITTPLVASSVQVIPIADGQLYRIIPGVQSGEFWIVNKGTGLIRLVESGGIWQTEDLAIDHMYDACGPDSRGNIYCSCRPCESGCGIAIFDTMETPPSVIENIPLQNGSYGAVLSPDEDFLYSIGCTWAGWGGESRTHRDTGIIRGIDLTSPTYDVFDQGITAALPETMYYAAFETGTDKLFVFCSERFPVEPPEASTLDVLLVEIGFPRASQIPVSTADYYYCNAIIEWPYGDHLIAICNSFISTYWGLESNLHGLWIIDTETNEVVDTYEVLNSYGSSVGVSHSVVSQVYPDRVYIAPGTGGRADEIIIFDTQSNAAVDWIDLPDGEVPFFLHELDDGRLIATTGTAQSILIIDPEG
jgi:hypothetical protein